MACVIESTSALASGTRTNSTVTAPSGIANDNCLVYALFIGAASGGTTATAPSGFSAPSGIPVFYDGTGILDSYGVRLYIWTKKAASESGNYTATHSSADTTAFMWRISGNDTTTLVDVNPTTTSWSGGGSGHNVITCGTQTTTVNGCALLWFAGTWDGFGAASPTSSWTERRNVTTEAFYVQDFIQTSAGATGSVAVTSTQGGDRPDAGVMLAIRASAGAAASLIQPGIIHDFAIMRASNY